MDAMVMFRLITVTLTSLSRPQSLHHGVGVVGSRLHDTIGRHQQPSTLQRGGLRAVLRGLVLATLSATSDYNLLCILYEGVVTIMDI